MDNDSHKQDGPKPQATFLTKLYALLEKPENHHMIRWDPQGEHIIVERPEQLALHVLPSIYRQSRFASFSRQLNIYGFMRKVNLRNVDPAIDDPDASTWSHPTLNRNSPPEVVANFKRRVPPRLPKPRKRDSHDSPSIPPPRSAIGMPPVPLSAPKIQPPGRARGYSTPGTFAPAGWDNAYPRTPLPPLTVPNDPPHMQPLYNHSPHPLHPISPAQDSPASATFNSYNNPVVPSQYNPYPPEQSSWSFSGSTSNHHGSLSSLLNPNPASSSDHYPSSRPQPTINTNYSSPFSSMPMHHAEHSASSMSPDAHSRPPTGYSMSSMQYDHDGYSSRPASSHHHRPHSPIDSRPQSSQSKAYGTPSLSVRRPRRHSQAMSPYPSPYEPHDQQRPSTSPQPMHGDEPHGPPSHHSNGAGPLPRVRSMIQLPSVDQYSFSPHHADFAYSAGGPPTGPGMGAVGARPGTGTSSISAASHTSSSQANTPPVTSDGYGTEDINRFSPTFGFMPMNEHLNNGYTKAGDI